MLIEPHLLVNIINYCVQFHNHCKMNGITVKFATIHAIIAFSTTVVYGTSVLQN